MGEGAQKFLKYFRIPQYPWEVDTITYFQLKKISGSS